MLEVTPSGNGACSHSTGGGYGVSGGGGGGGSYSEQSYTSPDGSYQTSFSQLIPLRSKRTVAKTPDPKITSHRTLPASPQEVGLSVGACQQNRKLHLFRLHFRGCKVCPVFLAEPPKVRCPERARLGLLALRNIIILYWACMHSDMFLGGTGLLEFKSQQAFFGRRFFYDQRVK